MTDEQVRLREALAGRYTIGAEVGRGGMATVYLGQDVKHHRKVAVKVLNVELATALGPERFLREIETAARLTHPHILPVYDSGDADGTLYYVMPFVEGESLHDKLRREKQLAVDEAIAIARDVADALSHAHTKNIIHRDIKPANIMLLSGHAVVSDFGVALVTQAVVAPRLTVSGIAVGTPLYMSPEQASGARDVDTRTDIYSLGCVLYEMLSGEPPFTGPNAHAILGKKLIGAVPPLRVFREAVSESLEDVTLKALSKTPADRFRTAAEFAEALKAVSFEQHGRSTGRSSERSYAHIAVNGYGVNLEGGNARRARTEARAHPESAPTPLPRQLAIAAACVLLLTAIGFIATTVYDAILHVPYQYTPSRVDFPIIGIRALIPPLYTAFVLLLIYVVAKQILRLLASGLRRAPPVRTTLDRWMHRSSLTWRRVWSGRDPAANAEIWFLLAIIASAAVVGVFVSAFVSAGPSDIAIFSCEYREVHRAYTMAMTVLIVALALSWNRVFRSVTARRATGVSFALARWGGLALIAGLILMLTAPWRVLWTVETPRALLNGERYYILQESDASLLLYNPRTNTTEHHRIEELPSLERLNTSGYVFEDEQAFASPDAGC